ncbi:hypothetical protein FB465_1204 [Kitasatospora atroaurantiaca]|uniref:Uncharacterized protein n=2 Tax=Streptomycetaceae TaxID=2062 RepID=A0A561EKT4_9ACTN|nr:hypothetical protein FB465_1204 [Kitasatospora atroaurantiaca]
MARYRWRVRMLSAEGIETVTQPALPYTDYFDGSAQEYADFLVDRALKQGQDDAGPMRAVRVVADVWEPDGQGSPEGHAGWPQ